MGRFRFKEMNREFTLYKPKGLPSNSPLVVFLHWYTGSASEVLIHVPFNDLADKYQFGVLYPEGLLDKYNNKHWNANLEISDFDDIGFISELTKSIQEEHGFSKENTFATGISNGGFMCYTLAMNTKDIFKAYAPVSGFMSLYDWENRTFSNPINLIHICGLADDVVPQDGSGKIEDGWGGAPHIDTITKYWADVAKLEKYNTKQLTTNTSKESYTSADSKYEVQCIKIKGHGHDYPGPEHDVDAGELMWNFFDKFITK